MARGNTAKWFNNLVTDIKPSQYIGGGGDRLYDVTFRTTEVAQQMVTAIDQILETEWSAAEVEDKYLWDQLRDRVTNANLQKICNTRFSLIKRGTGGKGGYNLLKKQTLKPWKDFKGKPSFSGVYVLGRTLGGAGLTLRFVKQGTGKGSGANADKINQIVGEIRRAIYIDWLNSKQVGRIFTDPPSYEDSTIKYRDSSSDIAKMGADEGLLTSGKRGYGTKTTPGSKRTVRQKVTGHTNIAHEAGSEVGAQALAWLKKQEPAVSFGGYITTHDIIGEIESRVGIKVDKSTSKTRVGGYTWNYHVKTSIRKNKAGSEDLDKKSIKEDEVPKAINNIILKNPNLWHLFFIPGSKKPVDQVKEDVIKDMLKPLTKSGKLDKRFKVNRKLKKFKPSKETGIVAKKPKAAPKPKVSKAVYKAKGKRTPFKVRTDKDIEKGRGRAASTANAAELAMTKKYIQGRLPAKVKQNMGRPALISQSGQFAGSVKLISLTPAANSIVAKYTYTLSGGGNSKNRTGVYSTFENSGRWPQAYNPKPLIAKSIRSLAEGRINGKLTTRRV